MEKELRGERLSIRLTREEKEELKSAAAEFGISTSALFKLMWKRWKNSEPSVFVPKAAAPSETGLSL